MASDSGMHGFPTDDKKSTGRDGNPAVGDCGGIAVPPCITVSGLKERKPRLEARQGGSASCEAKPDSRVGKSPLREAKLPLREGKFPSRVAKSPLRKAKFPLRVAKSPLRKAKLPLRKSVFHSREWKAHLPQ